MMVTAHSTIKTTDKKSREFLIRLVKERWGADFYQDFDTLSLLELESFAEYGDPRAFWEKEFDESRQYFEDKRGRKTTATATLNSNNYENWKDKSIAMRLGGFSMRKNIAISQKVDNTEIEKRRKIIIEILTYLPPKYKNVSKLIIENDLNKLAELCRDYYKPTIKKLLGPLILKRAHKHGLFIQINEIINDLNIGRSKFLHYQKILEDQGFFDSNNKDPSHEALIGATNNVIWKLKNANLIASDDVQNVQRDVKVILEKHDEIWRTRGKLNKVLALLALRRIKPEIKTRDLAMFLSDTKREAADLFKRVKSASNRLL